MIKMYVYRRSFHACDSNVEGLIRRMEHDSMLAKVIT